MSLEGTGSGIAIAKTSGYISAIAVFEYLGIPSTQIAILSVLMLIDMLTGVGKQFVLNPSLISSHEAWIGIIKKVFTLIIIFIIALMFKGMSIEGTIYINAVLSILIMAEAYSSIQNVYTIRTGKLLQEFDVISILLKSLGEVIKGKLEQVTSTNKIEEAIKDIDKKN